MYTIPDVTSIGQSDLKIAPLGVGTWAWGDTNFWDYGKSYGRKDLDDAFVASVNGGITLFDTAEVYGFGESERILGELVRTTRAPVVVATKYMPFPWRLGRGAVKSALHASVRRLGLDHVDLYQVHWPPLFTTNSDLLDALADAVAEGTIRAVGVSNYSAEQVLDTYDALERRGIHLASNQVNYSLLKRTPEINNVLTVCRERGMTVLAYSPLAQGLLTGKYTAASQASGFRALTFALENMRKVQEVVGLMREIGEDHGGKSPAQVALNWLMCQDGVVPIPGAKNLRQANENVGALGWALTPEEVHTIGQATFSWRR
jgi:aryl-alcohol dehydrogenase-like predicted oxidoreductase